MAVPNDVMAIVIVLGGEAVVGGASVSGSVLLGAIYYNNIIKYYSGAIIISNSLQQWQYPMM